MSEIKSVEKIHSGVTKPSKQQKKSILKKNYYASIFPHMKIQFKWNHMRLRIVKKQIELYSYFMQKKTFE